MSCRILLTHDAEALQYWYGERALAGLAQLGEPVVCPERQWSREALLHEARDCQLIVADRATPVPAELIEAGAELRAVVRCAMDIRTIDVETASRRGVLVTHAGPGFVQAVSEWVVAQLINLARGLPDYTLAWRGGETPRPVMGRQLAGLTAGVLGLGHIGRYLTPMLRALGMQVLIHDPGVTVPPECGEAVSRETLLARADAVICLAAHTRETEGMMDHSAFAAMKPGSWFINAARGALVDERALQQALNEGPLAGAALDVGSGEGDVPAAALAAMPGVLATPHIGGMVPEAIEYQALQTVEQVRRILRGEVPDGAVNADSVTLHPIDS
ncbi:D-3-phosphoglycerate dehydrogenase [Kushneria sinocarnis]|uniref:D-3-phosphoglycerate dehydrogenase n=1 Tax=Kushneria sinocarnis TaxID=595502 RepID=A0A420WWX8_9GAMM|nr:NAD(P)-dependent oxidoreductase [Kushneria sinocarnis]RKR04218.1 D-3-phosphoglycerate dehydrogenase [Kushneria sinocarnis]